MFHPDLVRVARFLPRGVGRPLTVWLDRWMGGLAPTPRAVGDVAIDAVVIPADPPVRVRVYRPPAVAPGGPAVVWIHGGGFVIGRAAYDDRWCAGLARDLGARVVSVDYRLAPEHPFPAALEDCHAALVWTAREADRVAIAGASAGGGLAAQLALLARDRGEVAPVFQLLVYPMLDDRSAVRPGVDGTWFRMWDQPSNTFGWTAYLGRPPGAPDVSPLAAPARHPDLRGLPPAAVSVGALDLFHDEDVAYAERLRAAGVPCALEVVDGAFHGFDQIVPNAAVSVAFRASMIRALAAALRP